MILRNFYLNKVFYIKLQIIKKKNKVSNMENIAG